MPVACRTILAAVHESPVGALHYLVSETEQACQLQEVRDYGVNARRARIGAYSENLWAIGTMADGCE
jgi:hypothetical protein